MRLYSCQRYPLFRPLVPPALLILFGFLVLAPLYRPSGNQVPIHSLIHWDAYGYHYPTLLYISDALRHGRELPLWNPFLGLGHPVIADPQSQLWSPVTWFISMTTGYSILAVQAQTIATFLLAGLGGYVLVRSLRYSVPIAWAAGASWMLSGYFVGHASHMGTAATMAWYPWTLAALVRAISSFPGPRRRSWSLLAGLALAQCAVGGHPLTALVAVINLVLFCFLWPAHRRDIAGPRSRLLLLTIVGVTALLAALPQVAALLWGRQVFAYLDQNSFSLEFATQLNALYARNALTLLLPGLATLGDNSGFRSNDLTMVPSYIGLAALSGLVLAAALRLHRPRVALLSALAALNLLMAMGSSYSPRALAYFSLPLMSAPHHASMEFRGFALLHAILVACAGWNIALAAIRRRPPYIRLWQPRLLQAAGILLLLGLLSTLYGLGLQGQSGLQKLEVFGGEIVAPLFAGEELLVQSLLLMLLCGILTWSTFRPRQAAMGLCLFVAIDLSSSVRRTWEIVADTAEVNQWAKLLIRERNRPRPFTPERWLTLSPEPDHEPPVDGLVHLLNYNPLRLLPRKEYPNSRTIKSAFGGLLEKRVEFLPQPGQAIITSLGPNHLGINTRSSKSGHLRILMSNAPGWQVSLNGEPIGALKTEPGNPNIARIPLPPGNWQVRLDFRLNWLPPAIAVLLATYGGVLAYALRAFTRRHSNRAK